MVFKLFDDMSRCTPEEVQRLLPLVPKAQQEEALRYKFTFGQYATLKSHLMLRELLAENGFIGYDAPLVFQTNEHGKPYLPDYPDVHFNISHCPKAIAVAVDSKPIGVDVERFVSFSDSLLHYCMNDREVREIQQAEFPDRIFARYWTMKEALFKQLGTGITHDLRDILDPPHPDVRIETELFDEKGYAFSLAIAN